MRQLAYFYKLLFLPTPVIYKVNPSPGESVGGGTASPVPCRLAAEPPSHPDTCKRASSGCDVAAGPVPLPSTNVGLIYYVTTSNGLQLSPEWLAVFAYLIFTTDR